MGATYSLDATNEMIQLTDEIDGDSPITEAASGAAKEGHAVGWVAIILGYRRISHDQEIASVKVGISESKQGGEVA